MHEDSSQARQPIDQLLSGPRGRRLCLDALAQTDERIGSAMFWFGHQLNPHPGSLVRFGDGPQMDDPSFTPSDIVALIESADATAVSTSDARSALQSTVDNARYWQEPDGVDAAAALTGVRAALLPAAHRVLELMPDLNARAAAAQWSADWNAVSDSAPITRDPAAVLAQWTREVREDEERSARERPADPSARYSGTWWSVPQRLLQTRSARLDALELVEDSFGWDVATLIPVRGAGRTLEIESAAVWAALCGEFPMEVTASRRHDWFRVTGHDGRWLIPDWERVSQRWDAVYLTTLGYLSAATQRIDVDDEYASVIAGWAPDSTIWLADVAREWSGPREQWQRRERDNGWEPSAT